MGTNQTDSSAAALHFALSQFLYREAALLDARDWDAWGKLFAPDGIYWVPASRGQTDSVNHVSLVNDNALLREIRLGRLKNADTASLHGAPNSSHLVSNIILAANDAIAQRYTLQSRFVMAQYASWGTCTFHGSYLHELVRDADGEIKIARKRVDLVDLDGPQGDLLTIL
ncbi:MAG TPA: aromatic-ring-hydroxylating dioxygenase subunit beta [Steroidobacteraceae bacterium]|jgi:benzoate/toluate 1,2-dioxygenase beta subunit